MYSTTQEARGGSGLCGEGGDTNSEVSVSIVSAAIMGLAIKRLWSIGELFLAPLYFASVPFVSSSPIFKWNEDIGTEFNRYWKETAIIVHCTMYCWELLEWKWY